MKILLTNDDGIDAPGIQVLKETLKTEHQVYLIAPKEEKSATGHAITVHHPLRAHKRGEYEWVVDGTPADCVKLGIHQILKDHLPDLIIAGINMGANLGNDIFYSGTVSAAMEGSLMGYPAMALSLVQDSVWDFTYGAGFALNYVRELEAKDLLTPSLLLNINFPPGGSRETSPIAYAPLGKTEYTEIFHHRIDPRKRPYYWMGGRLVERDNHEGSDVAMIRKGFVVITPLHMDLTDYGLIEKMKKE